MSNEALINRTPPHDNNAERAVLGSIFLEPQTLAEVMQYLHEDDFYHHANQILFHAMIDLSNRDKAIDSVTVGDYLKAQKQISAVGGMKYVAGLVNSVPTTANVVYYAKIVRGKAISRRLIKAAHEIADSGYTQNDDVDKMLDNAESKVMNISQERTSSGFKPIEKILKNSLQRISDLSKNSSKVTGLATGYTLLDQLTTGLHNGEFVVIAARPAMGKTTFALNIAQNVALSHPKSSVALFSLEMPAGILVNKMICSQGNIDAQHLRTGNLSRQDWEGIVNAVGNLSHTHIFIDDTSTNVSSIVASSRRLAKENRNLKLIIVDYLQLVEGNDKENRQQEVSEISRQLKKLSMELNIPVIALSQLSRSVEQREDKRPVLSDIRESGSIEQDADIVSFLYRKDYYERGKDDDGKTNNADNDASIVEVIIDKNRSGPRGSVHLMFIKSHSKFTNIEKIDNPQGPSQSQPQTPDGNF